MTQAFDATTPPTPQELAAAKKLIVKDEQGKDVVLGDLLFPGNVPVICIFIRHFYCGLCMDFISFLGSKVTPEMLEGKARLIIVGHGDSSMIKGYREMLGTPFPIYSDPTKQTYVTLGMTLRTLDAGSYPKGKEPEYLIRSFLANIVGSIRSAFKLGNLGANFGDIKQLGGEFVFGPQDTVLYTHRMENTRGHSSVATLMQAAGVPYESA